MAAEHVGKQIPAAKPQRRNFVLAPLFESGADLRALFSSGPFRGLFIARTTSSLGDAYATIAVPFAVLAVTHSSADVGYAVAARVLPTPILVLLAGVVADRWSRLRIMISMDLLRLISQGVFAYLLLFAHAALWQILALQVCGGVGQTFFQPASFGLVPHTVRPALLQQANAMQFLSFSVSAVTGPAIGGALVASTGPGVAIAIDAASFGLSALFLSQLRSVNVKQVTSRGSMLGDLVGGWKAVTSRRWIWLGIGQNALIGVVYFACFSVLGPVIAVRSLGGAAAYAVVASSVGIGSVVGAAASFTLRPRRPLRVAFTQMAGMAPLIALLAIPAPVAGLACAAFLSGLAIQIFNAIWNTTLQEYLHDETRSRVSSYDWFGSLALRPLGFAVIGPIAALLGYRATLLGSAAVIVACALGPLLSADVREFRSKEATEVTEGKEH